MLLAKGPRAPELALYLDRLALPLERLGKQELAKALSRQPWRLFEQRWIPLDAVLAHRLEWLIAEYLRIEDLAAAAVLEDLADRLSVDDEESSPPEG